MVALIRRLSFSSAFILAVLCSFGNLLQAQQSCELASSSYGAYTVWRNRDVLLFGSGMTVDADGSPRAYHPDNRSGLDDLNNAGVPGHWEGLATFGNEPIIQGEDDPAPSYFVSTTALQDEAYGIESPLRYLNSEEIPYVALPRDLEGPELGDVAYVVNTRNGRSSAAIVGDESPAGRLGEGSIALARRLGLDPDARAGGTDDGVVFAVFLRSGNHEPLSVEAIDSTGRGQYSRTELRRALDCVRANRSE